ncbi:MAG: arylsulfatase [Blastomonas sp.]
MSCAATGFAQDRTVLPLPDAPFEGALAPDITSSRADWSPSLSAPSEAPNILLVMTDDVGFATTSAFGGPIPTPNLDRLAETGLRFNRFNTTAICSPSRAALLTGRNAHQVGTGNLTDTPQGFPGYNARWPGSAATIARVLQLNGYSTAMFGKHHDLPPWQQSAAGPFGQWPTGIGFDYFYGFIGGDVHQFLPRLFRETSRVPDTERQGEMLDQRLIEDAIGWIHNQKAAAPDKPFMIYLAPGTLHAPHHAPADWIARFAGRFDQGWDVQREEIYKRQLASGIIPQGTSLTPRPAEIPAWDSLSSDQQKNAAHMMEVAAAQLAFQDYQFGRLLDELQRMGELDNTLVIFIEGDNGASGEAGPVGTSNELGALISGVDDTEETLTEQRDAMGGPDSYQNYPLGWAWAMNSPFQWVKQFASHVGGVRNAMVVSWPERIQDGGAIRNQYAHLIDIAPTILDAAGLPRPEKVYGVDQIPYAGISLLPSFSPGSPNAPRTQYYEISGSVGIYSEGWFAGRWTGRMPWEFDAPESQPDWELYNLDQDFSQSVDLASRYPEKLREMQEIFAREAKQNGVFPLDDRFSYNRTRGQPRPPYMVSRSVFEYWGADTSVSQSAAPVLAGRSFELTAEIDLPVAASGAILANGSKFGGWAFLLEGGRPAAVHAYSQRKGEEYAVRATQVLEPGQHSLRFVFAADRAAPGTGGTMQIFAGDRLLAEGRIERTASAMAGIGETLDIGRDTGVPVTAYANEWGIFSGKISHVKVTLAQ